MAKKKSAKLEEKEQVFRLTEAERRQTDADTLSRLRGLFGDDFVNNWFNVERKQWRLRELNKLNGKGNSSVAGIGVTTSTSGKAYRAPKPEGFPPVDVEPTEEKSK